ncbi:PREDICTED: protein FAM150A [Colobus angolensis palliatus]|uniref:protein FAM150A n=1 Tax=Colobus angolensis palliatus TaxID=336983 RepID=UPI0005F446FA|nr:PREDICTED: protein FAM150A [Colobus angolensis palliatus]
MWPLKPGAPLPALLLLALALSPPGAHGRPRGRRGAYLTGEEPKPLLFLPAAGAGRTPSGSRSAEIFAAPAHMKDQFLHHFQRPVTFSPECSKHFHRLYYNTRECSTPAYYKRCARLLTRLAVSPLCSQT